MGLFTLDYNEKTGESKYISTLPLQSVLMIVNQLIANEAVKNALEEHDRKKSAEKQTILNQAIEMAGKEDSNNG